MDYVEFLLLFGMPLAGGVLLHINDPNRIIAKPRSAKGELAYAKGNLYFGLGVGVPLILLSFIIGWLEWETAPVLAILIFLVGCFFTTPALMYYFPRYKVGPECLTYQRLVGRPFHVLWTDVARVQYNGTSRCFLLRLQDGKKLRISTSLEGLGEFVRCLRTYVSPLQIDTHAMIEIHRIFNFTKGENKSERQ